MLARPEKKQKSPKPGAVVNDAAGGDDAALRLAKDALRALVERIELLEDEKSAIASDIGDVFKEAKSQGFDVKALRQIIRLRKIDPAEREEQGAILKTYMHALGMVRS
jgi:uncharacterized protein (UPF0335 family)